MSDYSEGADLLFSEHYKTKPEIDKSRLDRFALWLAHVTKSSDKDILDVGCGEGYLSTKVKSKSYTGLDVSSYVVFRAKSNLQRSGNHISFVHGNAEYLPFENNQFGLVICTNVLEYLPPEKIEKVLTQLNRVAPSLALTIGVVPSDSGPKVTTVRSPNWWREKISKTLTVREELIGAGVVSFFCGEGYTTQRLPKAPNPNMRIRQKTDGSIWIPRRDRKTEEYLDQLYERVADNQLVWFPRIENPQHVMNLTQKYPGKIATIVGKGPSLDFLSEHHFEGSGNPVIAINQAIHKVEAVAPLLLRDDLFILQQDQGIDCRPQRAQLLLHATLKHLYPEITNRFLFQDRTFGYGARQLSVIMAIKIAKLMGCTQLNLVSFDASVNGQTHYARVIGIDPVLTASGGQERFLAHKARIIKAAGTTPIKWITPE